MGATPNAKVFWTTGLVFAAFAAASVASAQILPLNPSRYRIIPAPQFSSGWAGSATGFAWVDNERLLFLANDQQLSQTEQRGNRRIVKKGVPTIHLWDFRAGSITRYRDEPLADYLCAIDGKVYYGLKRDGRTVTLEGPFGEERERPGTPPRFDQGGRRLERGFNRFACKEYWYAEVPRPNGGRAILLRGEHGIYERLARNSKRQLKEEGRRVQPYKWWNHVNGNSKEIPFPQENINDPLGYSSIVKGYLFQHLENQQREGMRNTFFLWAPAANSVRRLDIVGNENWTSLSDPRVTRFGLIVKNPTPPKSPRDQWDVGPAGIYLFKGSSVDEFMNATLDGRESERGYRPFTVEQLISGIVDQLSEVSPDGCKVVVVVDPMGKEERKVRLEAVDLCGPGG